MVVDQFEKAASTSPVGVILSEVEGISRLTGPARKPNCTTCHPERSMIVRRTIMRSRRIPITRTALNVLGFPFRNHRNSKP